MENTNTVVENTAVAVVQDMARVDLVEQLKNPNGKFFCSIKDDGSRKSKVAIYNAINNPEKRIADMINTVIEAVNVVAFPVSLVNEETGEINDCLSTVIIDKNGVGYAATSEGITNSLSRIFSIVGMPNDGAWEKEPVKMKIRQINTRNGDNKILSIELV